MSNKNSDINKIKQILTVLIIILSILVLGIIIYFRKEILEIIKVIYNVLFCTNNKFNSINLWLCILSITILIGFFRLRKIVKTTETTKVINNNNGINKDYFITNQREYKKEVIKLIEEINPIKLMEIVSDYSEDNTKEISLKINKYKLELNTASFKLKYYEDNSLIGDYKKRETFEKELNKFKTSIEKKLDLFYTNINKCNIDNQQDNITRLKESGTISQDQEMRLKKIQEKYKSNDRMCKSLLEENDKVIKSIIDLINENWLELVILSNEMINERETYTKNKIDSFDITNDMI